MNAREGFRRAARLSAWAYWIIAGLCILAAYNEGRNVYRQTFNFTGDDGVPYSVEAYTSAAANDTAFQASHGKPHTTSTYPSTVFLTTAEPEPHNYPRGYEAARNAFGIAALVYGALWAICRAFRWVASGFFPERPRATLPDLPGE